MTGYTDATADTLIEWLQQLRADLRIPGLGVYRSGSRREAVVAAAARASSMRANPIALGAIELHQVLASAT